MFDKLRQRLTGQTTAGVLSETLTDELKVPSVYRVVLVNKESGRKINDTKELATPDIDFDSLTSVKDLREAIEGAFPDDDVSAKLVSPTDADGVEERMHLKTLRDAAS